MSNEHTGTPEAETYTTHFDEHGHEVAHFSMVRTGGPKAIVYARPRQAIPIVFVPGIMGTPLVVTEGKSQVPYKKHKWAWFPDSERWMGGGTSLGGYFTAAGLSIYRSGFSYLKPEQKSQMMKVEKTRVPHPEEAELDGLSYWRDGSSCFESHLESEYRRRGWGSVVLGENGYGSILYYLDDMLNNIYCKGHMTAQWKTKARDIHNLIYEQDTEDLISHQDRHKAPFTEDDLVCMGNWYFPIYAAGYNWLESNDRSAQCLAKRIDDILKDCNERLGFMCEKVILVTHSMGGLVARMCAKKYSDKIMGVVHGVQPINGAASAYHRVVAGWDGGAGMVLGRWAEDLVPIFSNPGPLQLLPNKQYGAGWLTIDNGQNGFYREQFLTLPFKNPYQEIYQDTESWWRVVDLELVMPESKKLDEKSLFYKNNLDQAEIFHDELHDYFHPNTYVHYGQSQKYPTWYRININVNSVLAKKEDILPAKMIGGYGYTDNKATIKVSDRYYSAHLSNPNEPGDGTVPAASMQLENNSQIKAVTVIDNIEHAASYGHEISRLATLYGICRIVHAYDMGA